MKSKVLYICCLLLPVASLLLSCIKQDAYKDFLKDGEIDYAGRVDTVIVRTGNERAVLFVALGNDPLVNQVDVYWNNGDDSLITAVQRSSALTRDTVQIALEPMAEGSYNFQVYTADSRGSRSVVIGAHGFVYGPDYVNTLENRKLSSMEQEEDGSVKLAWQSPFAGETGIELVYNDGAGQAQFYRVPPDETTTVLVDYEKGGELRYRSLYKPDTLSLDEFSTAPTTIHLPDE